MDYLKFILLFGFIIYVHGQIITGCPRKWVYNAPNCYKFEQDEQLIFDEASAACYNYDAKLLSINSYAEHNFITEWLKTNDRLPPSIWLTSGYFENGKLTWEGDGIQQIDTSYWAWLTPMDEHTKGRVAYMFEGAVHGVYGWTNVSSSIAYNYICEIEQVESKHIDVLQRGEDYGFGIIDPKDLPRGPYLVHEPENMIVVKGELSVFLECTSGGNPYPSFTWWKESRDAISNNVYIEQVTSATNSRYTLSSGRFTIEDPEESDTGYYRCMATNKYGAAVSRWAHIAFGYLAEFPSVEPNDYKAKAFRGIRVDCNTPQFWPEVRYEWSKFGTAAWLFPGGSYTFVSQAGYMYFSELQPTDQKEYFCFVTLAAPKNYRMNTHQPPMVINKGVWIIVIHHTDATPFGPDIKTHAFPSPALKGLSLRLECIAYGTLPISYRWRRKDGRPFVKGTRIHDRSRVLEVDNAPLSAEGEYICTAIGKNGVAEKTLTVAMEAEPYFPYEIGDMFVDPGQSMKWTCKAVARPKATYTWYKNGEPIVTKAGEIEIRGKGTQLFINSIDKDRDEGMYQCAATNNHGTKFSTGRLRVLSFVPNFDKHPLPPMTLAPVGGNITIPCEVEAAPIPTVRWLKNGADLGLVQGDTVSRIGMSYNFELRLTQIQYSDSGTYICEAENINGKAANLTLVRVVEGVRITSPPTNTNVRVNQTAFLYCHAAYNYLYDVTYQWKFNGHLIDFRLSPEYVVDQNQGSYGLYITQTQYEHSGSYECTALTTLHSDSRSALLAVTGPPGPPAGVYIEELSVTSYSVQLVWTIGVETDHGDPITSYDIEAESHYHPGQWHILMTDVDEISVANEAMNLGKRTDQRSLKVVNLIPNTGYRFRVRAINNFGRGELPSRPSVTAQTPSEAPVVAPRHVSGGGGKVGTLTITWEPLDIAEHSGPNLGYNIYWKLHEDKKRGWKKEKILDKNAKRYFEDNAEKVERIMFTITIGPDNYYLQYDTKIGCYNDKGDGPNSTVSIIYSAEGMPVARPKMMDNPELNATAVWVKWYPVPDDRETMKGRVRGYTVQYFKRVDMFMPFEGFEPDYIKQKEVYGTKNYVLIIGLEPVTEYFARVQVWNSAGRGPKGEWRRSETRHAAPHDYPTHVEVRPHTDHSIHVQWRGISTHFDEESLEGYIVRVWKIQEDIRTATDTHVGKNPPEAIIENLQRETVYVLRVLGVSWGGEGQKSEATYFTVMGGNIPFDPTTSDICYSITETCGRARNLQFSHILIAFLLTAFLILTRLT